MRLSTQQAAAFRRATAFWYRWALFFGSTRAEIFYALRKLFKEYRASGPCDKPRPPVINAYYIYNATRNKWRTHNSHTWTYHLRDAGEFHGELFARNALLREESKTADELYLMLRRLHR